MLLGQHGTVSSEGFVWILKNIKHKMENISVTDDSFTNILAIKHHKKYRVLVKIIFHDNKYIEVGKDTLFQIVEEHDIPRLVPAKDIQPGCMICPPIPLECDIRLWADAYGINVKTRQLVLTKSSTVIFDECDYVTISNIPILHDNHEDKKIRMVARRSNSLANLFIK